MVQLLPTEQEPAWLRVARAFEAIGIGEVPGIDANPLILAFFKYTTLGSRPAALSDETAWCSAFVCACLEIAGERTTRSTMARSWLRYGRELAEPKRGAIAVFQRGTDKRQGHVGFYVGQTEDKALILGGNQRNRVCIRDAEKKDLLSYRWPLT